MFGRVPSRVLMLVLVQAMAALRPSDKLEPEAVFAESLWARPATTCNR